MTSDHQCLGFPQPYLIMYNYAMPITIQDFEIYTEYICRSLQTHAYIHVYAQEQEYFGDMRVCVLCIYIQSIPRLQKIFANYRKTDLLFETGFVACQNQFQIEDKLIQSHKRVGHPGCRSYFGTVRPDCAGRLPTNIFYLKTVLANTKGTNLVDHPTEYLLFEKLFVVQSCVENLGSIQLISSI